MSPSYVYKRTNYRVTGKRIDSHTGAVGHGATAAGKGGQIAHGEYSRVTANAAATALDTAGAGSVELIVSTGLKSPAYGIAMPWESDSGMSCHKGAGLFFDRVTGSYLVFIGMVLTSTNGDDSSSVTWCAFAAAAESWAFVWVAFED